MCKCTAPLACAVRRALLNSSLRGARLKYRIDLAALFDDFPGTRKSGRDDEACTGTEFHLLPCGACEHHPAAEQVAKLVLRVAYGPAPAACRPYSGKKLLRGVAVMIPSGE